jgi:hypothetical protein
MTTTTISVLIAGRILAVCRAHSADRELDAAPTVPTPRG